MKANVIRERVANVSGIPLGGIGTGTIEIRPDGYFHDWLIFNTGGWAPSQPEHERDARPNMDPSALSFAIRTKQGNDIKLRRLGMREDQNELYSLGYVKNVQQINFDGRFPVAELEYVDDTLPVEVSSIAFSPIIPHDSQTSGTPGFHIKFSINNTSNQPVEVSLLGQLKNPLAWNLADRELHNEITHTANTARITMRTDAKGPKMSTIGDLTFSVEGGEPSWIQEDVESYIGKGSNSRIPYGGFCYESLFWQFRRDGHLPSLTPPKGVWRKLPKTAVEIEALSDDDKRAWIKKLCGYASLKDVFDKISHTDANLLQQSEGMTRFLNMARERLFGDKGEGLPNDWACAALSSKIVLQPGETQSIRFTLAWYFPHHFSERGPEMGHMYETWFKDSLEVSQFMSQSYNDHKRKVVDFVDTLFDTNLPSEMALSWSSQLSTVTKCSWWTKNGKFAIWEGLGCCGFHTTDITYQGSFNLIALWPDLQKGQMAMGADYQRADGRVHHFFTPDLTQVDNGFDRVDMNPQFVMMVCRDYLWTGDKAYIERLWPNVVRAIDSSLDLDSDGDGLPDRETNRNTYDAWDLDGTPSYIASLWLGSLIAGVRLARELGHEETAERWNELLERGKSNIDKRLWNGEYYSLWNNGSERDECCMTDQMSGEWFTNLMGIGHALPKERVVQALRSIYQTNFDPELGIVNANYPEGVQPKISAYRHGQATALWTGIEYAIASMFIDFGLFVEGEAIVQTIHDRYARGGRIWNQVECGDHYYRAMSSWATLLAATGFKPDLAAETLVVCPPVSGDVIAPWFASTGYGKLEYSHSGLRLECRSGEFLLRRLVCPIFEPQKVTIDGNAIAFRLIHEPERQMIELDQKVALAAGKELICC